jgi:hypothetical protein
MEAGPSVGANKLSSPTAVVAAGGVEYRISQPAATIAINTSMEAIREPRFILAILHLLGLEQKFQ